MTKAILDNIGAMKVWVGQQAIMKLLSDTFVGYEKLTNVELLIFNRRMMMMLSSLLHQGILIHLTMWSDSTIT